MDLLVRKPETVAKRLEMGDMFMQQVIDEGIVLHDARDP